MQRRTFLKAGLSSFAWLGLDAALPRWFLQSAEAACSTCFNSDKILVVLQMAGGNDGLNTVIPYTDSAYFAARPTIGVPKASAITLDALNGLHPQMPRLANWYQKGRMGVIQNVGYVNPNLSHFVATDYYELGVAPSDPIAPDGWIARYYDHACTGCTADALLMTASGISATPKSMLGSDAYVPPAVSDPASYNFTASNDSAARFAAMMSINNIVTTDSELSFLQNGYNVAQSSVVDIAQAAAIPSLVLAGSYPAGSLGNGLALVSQIIRGGFPTKIFYVSQGGYDTHSDQVASASPLTAGAQPALLNELDLAVDAFLTEMELSGNLDRVVVMTFSEFGRRVAENGSLGTDHGAGNSSFVFGGINPGIYGGQPDLVNMISGSLRHQVDFRSVYTMALQGLFGVSTAAVFGQGNYDSIITPDLPKIPFLNLQTAGAVKGDQWIIQ